MPSLTLPQAEVLTALKRHGIDPAAGSIRPTGQGIAFSLAEPHKSHQVLGNSRVFQRDAVRMRHTRILKGALAEYRAFRRGPSHSLHVVVGRNGEAYAGLDRYSPYRSAVGLLWRAARIRMGRL